MERYIAKYPRDKYLNRFRKNDISLWNRTDDEWVGV